VDTAQAKADKIIKQLRQLQLAQHSDIKENQLIEAKTALNNLHQSKPVKQNRVLRREKAKQSLRQGDTVKSLQYGQTGTLMKQVDKTHWEVQLGIIRMQLPTSDLQKVTQASEPEPKRRITTVRGATGPSTTLDLRGERYEAAMAKLDQYIDAALLAGYPQVTIIHGLGTGAIRNGVTKYLRQNKQVAKFGFAPQNAGGGGATIVQFK
jgi:DNA mismatch repair protein MutS2